MRYYAKYYKNFAIWEQSNLLLIKSFNVYELKVIYGFSDVYLSFSLKAINMPVSSQITSQSSVAFLSKSVLFNLVMHKHTREVPNNLLIHYFDVQFAEGNYHRPVLLKWITVLHVTQNTYKQPCPYPRLFITLFTYYFNKLSINSCPSSALN